jgi:hypothetical protein
VIRPVLQAGVKSASARPFVGVLVIVALAWTGYLSWLVIHQPEEFVLTDDAYISLRYAQNWVNGAGIVWQPGDRVEGYTNFLQVALFASGLRLGLSGELVAYTVGFVSALGSLVVAALIARRLSTSEQDNGWAGGIAAVLIGANPFFAYWSMSGLETPLFILFCLLSVWAFYETLSAGLRDRNSARLSSGGSAWRRLDRRRDDASRRIDPGVRRCGCRSPGDMAYTAASDSAAVSVWCGDGGVCDRVWHILRLAAVVLWSVAAEYVLCQSRVWDGTNQTRYCLCVGYVEPDTRSYSIGYRRDGERHLPLAAVA